jgi:hypothetical protein
MKQFIIIDTEDGFTLISPNTLEFCNQGSNAYPPYLANNLKVGEELKSTFNDGRSIKRVA